LFIHDTFRLCTGGELSSPSLEDDFENSLQDEDNCFEDGGAHCKNNPHNNKNSQTKSRQGSGPTLAGGRDKIAEIGRFSAIDGAGLAPARVNEGRRVEGGGREVSHGSTAAGSRPRQGKEIQALSGAKATAVRRPAAADRADDGAAAVLAARDDRQMEEFRAAKHFNCTGRDPGLYADVKTGCKVRCAHCNENSIYLFLFWELCGLHQSQFSHSWVCERFTYSQDRWLHQNRHLSHVYECRN
jgi:hypothetical protein